MHAATSHVKAIEYLQAANVSCVEEIFWRSGWIDDQQLLTLSVVIRGDHNGRYLKSLRKVGIKTRMLGI
jgi:glucose-1-phosphate thymidylyltransferase